MEAAAQIEGLYVPMFYDVTYHEDGTLESFAPNNPYAPQKVKKQVVSDMARQIIRKSRWCRLLK